MATLDAALVVLARIAASRYKRKCWWADRAALEQQAWVAMLEAQRTHDPQTGVPFAGYAWRAIINQLHGAVLRESAPVSAPDRKLPDLKGIYREMLDAGLVDPTGDPYHLLVQLERRARLLRALDAVMSNEKDGDLAAAVLLREETPREVARTRRVPVQRVYAAVRRAKIHISRDYLCWRFWQEGTS